MIQLSRDFRRRYRQAAVLASLVFATAICLGLLVFRATYAHRPVYTYLAWNLFLAWLPMLCSLAAYNVYKRHTRLSWLVVVGCALAWLLFFPNAPYLLTDLQHLQPRADAPFWFDLLLLIAFAWTGFFLGLVSLFLMQAVVRRAAGSLASWACALAVLGLSGFAIYFGNFLRWNSWDVFYSPGELLAEVFDTVRHPLLHAQTFAFSLLFSLFLVSGYLMLVALTQFQLEPESQ